MCIAQHIMQSTAPCSGCPKKTVFLPEICLKGGIHNIQKPSEALPSQVFQVFAKGQRAGKGLAKGWQRAPSADSQTTKVTSENLPGNKRGTLGTIGGTVVTIGPTKGTQRERWPKTNSIIKLTQNKNH